jgi:hypothetical protein
MKRAWKDHGHSLDDPGEVEQIYLEDEGVIVVDLNPEGDGRERR